MLQIQCLCLGQCFWRHISNPSAPTEHDYYPLQRWNSDRNTAGLVIFGSVRTDDSVVSGTLCSGGCFAGNGSATSPDDIALTSSFLESGTSTFGPTCLQIVACSSHPGPQFSDGCVGDGTANIRHKHR